MNIKKKGIAGRWKRATGCCALLNMSSCSTDHLSLIVRKPVFGVFDQVPHKPGCTITEDDKRLEISDLGKGGLFYPYRENKGADQLRCNREADLSDLRLCFRIYKKPVFSRCGSFFSGN